VVVLNDWEFSGWPVLTESDYAVQFDLDNERYYSWYNEDGTWVGTAYVVNDYNTLPVYVHNTISNKYPAYTISSVNRTYDRDMITYEVMLKSPDNKMLVLIDENGNVIRYKMK
jgi:hypothetical protein